MKKFNLMKTMIAALAISVTASCFAGCTGESKGGILHLTVNPEISIEYDANGRVTAVSAKNDDGSKVLANYTDYKGKACDAVIVELLGAIEEKGYFTEEIEAEKNRVVLEIENGSKLPYDNFLNDITAEIKTFNDSREAQLSLNIEGEKNFGYTDYHVTDYGLTDYDITDYGKTDYDTSSNVSSSKTGSTDYGVTDYGKTDYDTSSNVSFSKTDSTDYDVTDYGKTDYEATNYEATDYR